MAKAKKKRIELDLELDPVEEKVLKPRTWSELSDEAKTMPEREFFAEGIIDSEGISVVFAPPKSFKSAFIAHVAHSASLGRSPFEGVKNSHRKECDVLYLDAELYIQDWAERYSFPSENLKTFTKEDFSKMNIDLGVNEFIGFLEENFRSGFRMIVIDNLSLVVPQASDHKIAAEYISALNHLMGRLKESKIEASLVLIAHSTKENIKPEFGVTTQSMGGAFAWQKPAQSVVALNKRKDLDDGEYGFYIKVLETRRRNNSGISGRSVLAFRVEGVGGEPMQLICEGLMREDECLGSGGLPNLARTEAKSSEAKMTLMALLESAGLGTNTSADFVGQVFKVSGATIKQYKNPARFPEARSVFDRVTNAVLNDSSYWVECWERTKEDLHRFGGELPMTLPKYIQDVISAKRKRASTLDAFEAEDDAMFNQDREAPF